MSLWASVEHHYQIVIYITIINTFSVCYLIDNLKTNDLMENKFIPVNEPNILETDLEYSYDAIKSGFWSGTSGKYIKEFEEKFSKFTGTKYGVSCCNGTVALQLAVRALNIKKDDEVICASFTNIASILCVVYEGAKPVLVDSRKDTWCIDEEKIEEKITQNTKAIIPVHIYGHPCKMDKIMELAKKYNLKIIEDAAEAHGSEYNGKRAGSFGDINCFSFYSTKIIQTGEGGMCLTNDDKLAERLHSLKGLAYGDTNATRFIHKDLGYNFRMSNIIAAIGCSQMLKINETLEKRKEIANYYNEGLKGIPGLQLPVNMPWAKNVYWVYGIVIDEEKFGMGRDTLMDELNKKGIDTRPFFASMSLQDALLSRRLINNEKMPVSEWLGKNGLYLPSSTKLAKDQMDYIIKTIKELHV
jgi:perosamine synthetase